MISAIQPTAPVFQNASTSLLSDSSTALAPSFWTQFEEGWAQMMTDIQNDKTGQNDAQVTADAKALNDMFSQMTPAMLQQFASLAGESITTYSGSMGNNQPVNNIYATISFVLAGLLLARSNLYNYYETTCTQFITSVTYNGVTTQTDTNSVLFPLLTKLATVSDLQSALGAWQKLETDIANDKNGSLDSQVQSEAQALATFLNGLSPAEKQEFGSQLGGFLTGFNGNQSPDDLLNVLCNGLQEVATSAHPADTFNQTVNTSISTANYKYSGEQPTTFSALLSQAFEYVIDTDQQLKSPPVWAFLTQ